MPEIKHHPSDFRFYLTARFLTLTSYQMLNVALGQYIYELTRNPLYLGYVGLTLFGPKFAFSILAGHTADRWDRRGIILICRILQFLGAVLLIHLTSRGNPPLWTIYGTLLLLGTANAFDGPASQALVPQLVPVEKFRNAVTWNSTFVQISFIIGPALAGWLYAYKGQALFVFEVIAAMRVVSVVLISMIRHRTQIREKAELSWKVLMAGIRYVFEKKIILGAISLDLFAVLFGGAVALMPIYANEILHVGPQGLGYMRAAPALGAALLALGMVRMPPLKNAGKVFFSCVAIFGIATILFGISKNFYFSLACLFVLGAADMVSVVIRGVLVQMKTPEEMRGRVSAVNLVFIGASNELGEFESGLTAKWFGTVPAVVIGGIGTLLVVAVWAWRFPELRKYKRLEET